MRISITTFLIAITAACMAQPVAIISSGFSRDVNTMPGSSINFTHVPISIQWQPGGYKDRFMTFVKLDYLLPFEKTGSDLAYTINSRLPRQIMVKKTIRPHVFNVNGGIRFRIFKHNKTSFYGDALLTLISIQNIRVSYANYDGENYEILNPDESLNRASVGMGIGLMYRYRLNNASNLYCMLHIQSPPLASAKRDKYELSYRLIAPLQLTVGYGFNYKKNK